ncbi:hypothetical protein HXX76_014301 [Chlamydomonas incerta]|uniref:Dynein heavy chain C-terminal domain-containing protein n=1 Tax=Chlamydomonas incerta TaxID=51695 RepID=A0A835SQ20_CHLIN|nr:hypothetical protein HXX76_014301 [Chlamydomonas incerta]|eukprot:KAG2424725.1 hypothetical protein HXX76_014301 [Chlamydomonas incerta]
MDSLMLTQSREAGSGAASFEAVPPQSMHPINRTWNPKTHLEGCRWSSELHELEESEPKVLFTPLPPVWMVPREMSRFASFPHYLCPMYKTTERRGVLSTTGHSTNFVLDVKLASSKDPAHWTKRGVALITSLND